MFVFSFQFRPVFAPKSTLPTVEFAIFYNTPQNFSVTLDKYFNLCYNKFTYDRSGKRTKKVADGITHEYFYDGDRLITEKRGNNYLHFFYDESGVCGMRYNGKNYEFVRNLFGDVIRIYDGNTLVARYSYDCLGNCTVHTNVNSIATVNPFRYRGYYYDVESGLYYLMSRYYDPEIGRFISPDTPDYLAPDTIDGVDLYAYGLNNPVMYVDPTGHAVELWQGILAGIGVALIVTAAALAIFGTGGVAAFGIGALIGAAAVGAVGAGVGATVGYLTEGTDGILGGALAGFGIGATVGFIVGGAIGYYNSLVQVDINKFTKYVLEPSNSKGKHVIFKNLGYDKANAKSLVRLYKKQGFKNLVKKNFTLGKLDQYGQRINMVIQIGGKSLNSAWMMVGKGIRLVSPFVGFL